ncbi:aspartic peptidase domain-containing protein, partial [Vararia minispora EC-137]
LGKRSHVSGLTNGQNIEYSANITLNGQSFSALIDTGSSDLWVAGTVPSAASTGKTAVVNYAVGSAEGTIKTASLDFLGYTIPDQAYIEVAPSSSNPEGQGIIGLGPNSVSQVYNTLGDTSTGYSPINRIFRQNVSSPNFLSVLLGRSDDPDDPFPGQITVGEVLSGYQNISSQPRVNVTYSNDQHWQVLLDPNGVLGPDGKPFNYTTGVSSTTNKLQLTAIFDTGFSLPQVPRAISDGIYGRFEGASFKNVSNVGEVWILPCNLEVNITIKFGGTAYPMHPLDTNFDIGLNQVDANGNKLCVGSLQPITTAAATSFDIILGMSWLRNVYLMVNYGDFIDGTTNRTTPFVQALPTTDPAAAHQDFVQARLNGIDTTGSQRLLNAPVTSPSNPESIPNSNTGSWFSRHWVIIAIAAASTACGLLLLTLI